MCKIPVMIFHIYFFVNMSRLKDRGISFFVYTKFRYSNAETLIHLLKCSLGTGILAMPQAFARAGLVTGILATVIVGVIVTHCLHVLVRLLFICFFCERFVLYFINFKACDSSHNVFLQIYQIALLAIITN